MRREEIILHYCKEYVDNETLPKDQNRVGIFGNKIGDNTASERKRIVKNLIKALNLNNCDLDDDYHQSICDLEHPKNSIL